MQAAFDGLRVADFSDRLSAAFAGRLFADYGADVALVEPPGGHPLRAEPPFLDDRPGAERSALHAYANWNKRSLRIADASEAADAVRWADLVITSQSLQPSQSPPAIDLRALRGDAVHLSVTAHGLEGELAGVRGNNLTASARCGWAYINAYQDEPPLQLPSRQAGYVGGLAGFVAAAAALLRRGNSAEAERVDVSELEALAITCMPWAVGDIYYARGDSRGPMGGRQRGEPGPLYRARDGKINLGFGDWHNWPQAMALLNLPDQGAREDLIPHGGRYTRDMSAVRAGATRELPAIARWPLFHALARLRCISGCLQSVDELVENEQLTERGFVAQTSIEGRAVRAAGAPGRIEPPIWSAPRPAPQLGEHSEELRREFAQPSAPPATAVAPGASSAPGAPGGGGSAGPLDGVRVLAFTQAWSGTLATQLLSLLGADVVQIEALRRPDIWRTVGGRVPPGIQDERRTQHPLNTQGLFNAVNLNKKGITLDLSSEAGRALFWRLVPRFDVVAENFRPGVLDGWGITLETLGAVNPRVILATISGYGVTGPYAPYPANGATTEPMSGFSSIHGYEGDEGMNSGGLYPDPVSGYTMAGAVLAALHRRERVDGPQRIDLSMIESTAAVCGDAIVELDATGRIPRPLGNRDRRYAPHNIYAAAGGEFVAIAAESEADWRAIAGLISRAELGDDPRFADAASRKANEAALDEIIAQWTRERDAGEIERSFTEAGLIAARVASFYRVYDEPEPRFAASGFLQLVDHPEVGPSWLAGGPWRLSGPLDTTLRASPCLGQHTQEVLAEELGVTAEEYQALVAAGVSGTLDEAAALKRRTAT